MSVSPTHSRRHAALALACAVCLAAIFEAFRKLKNKDWMAHCDLWLYRGAWQEWEPDKIEMAVPLSPSELGRKRNAVFKHQSQKDKAMFPGADERESDRSADHRITVCQIATPASRISSSARAPSPGSSSTDAIASARTAVSNPSRRASSAVALTQ